MNKKGTEKLVSIYWFVILFMVAGAIIYMVSIFYSGPYDVREVESTILAGKIAECISDDGKLKYSIVGIENDFFEKCNLNLKTDGVNEEYYVSIEIFNYENRNILSEFFVGNENLKKSEINKGVVFHNSRDVYVLDQENNELLVRINVSIDKTNKNVK